MLLWEMNNVLNAGFCSKNFLVQSRKTKKYSTDHEKQWPVLAIKCGISPLHYLCVNLKVNRSAPGPWSQVCFLTSFNYYCRWLFHHQNSVLFETKCRNISRSLIYLLPLITLNFVPRQGFTFNNSFCLERCIESEAEYQVVEWALGFWVMAVLLTLG